MSTDLEEESYFYFWHNSPTWWPGGSRWRLPSPLISGGQNQGLPAGQSLAQILVSVIMIGLVQNEIFLYLGGRLLL